MDYTFTLDHNEAQMVATALAALPYGQVAALIAKLSAQAAEQTRAANAEGSQV